MGLYGQESGQGYWWRTGDEDEVHNDIFSYIKYLEQRQIHRIWRDRVHEALYENDTFGRGRYADTYALLRSTGLNAAELNVTRNMIDAVVSKIASKNPAVKASPTDADWSVKVRARKLTKFIRGKLQSSGFDDLDDMIVRDCLIKGTGIVKIAREHGEIVPMRVPKQELFIDERDARYGNPRQIHHRMQIAREVAKEMFPEKRGLIDDAPETSHEYGELYDYPSGDTNMIWIAESWHLPSGPDATDGRRVICTENATLLNEQYDRPRFPLAFLHWSPAVWGFWGRGICDEVGQLQLKINEVAEQIQEAISWARLIVFTQRGSGINKSHLGARHPHILEYTGQRPEFEMPNVYSAQMLQFLDWLVQQAYDITGVSRMSAQAKKPAGLDSGRALEVHYDIESERFATFEQAYGHWRVAVGELYIDEAKALSEENEGGYTANWADRDIVERIDWGQVDLQRDQFRLGLEPTSFLPDTRAGKVKAIEELTKIGVIAQEWIPALIDAPDIERFNRVKNAPFEAVERHMELLMDVDEEMPNPDAFLPHQQAQDMGKAYLLRCEAEGAPEEVLQRFRDYISLVEANVTRMEEGMAEQQAAQGMVPGNGMPAPGGGVLPPAAPPEALGAPGEGVPGL